MVQTEIRKKPLVKLYSNNFDSTTGRYNKTYLTADGGYHDDMACFIVLANNSTGAEKPLFLMNSVDARKFCSDPRTKSLKSMAIWRNAGDWDNLKRSNIVKDNGSFKEVLKELNIIPYSGETLYEQWNALNRV